ncbi:MAG: AAA family ATPase [Candidatus Tectimicrobiota bacterium]
MYQDFYRLKKTPFHITPDPEFLFLSPSHKAALGALVYGIEERQGFVALVGEVGLGKTTILRSYLERVDQSQLKTIYIFNSNVSFPELLKTMCREFGIDDSTEDIFETVNRLHQVLVDEYRQGRNVALIVDEAQHMPIETLEHLRMLSNLETSTQKLIQIVLVGQPEFEDKLNAHALRQLKQRLVIRGAIAPLTEEESRAYIEFRLMKVSTTQEPIFSKGALRLIIKHARGTPRVLNILCTNALIQGFGQRQRRISAATARAVIAEYAGKKSRRVIQPRYVIAAGIVLLALLFWFSPYRQILLTTINTWHFWSKTRNDVVQSVRRPAPQPLVSQETPVKIPAPVLSLPAPPEPAESARSSPGPLTDAEATAAPSSLYTVRKGDHLSRVAQEVYGVSNQAVLTWIRKHNPQLRSLNQMDVGTQLTLPPLPPQLR